MKTLLQSILFFFVPFLIVILINEFQRVTIKAHDFKIYGVSTMNTVEYNNNICSWACHNNTMHCKTNHATTASVYSEWIDPLYFGTVKVLQGTGNYGIANVLLLVFAWPLLMSYLFIRTIQMRKQLGHE